MSDPLEALLDAKRRAEPATQIREQLAPTRARALELHAEYVKVVGEYDALFEGATARYVKAASAGLRDQNLHQLLLEVHTTRGGCAHTFMSIVHEIDSLTNYAVGQGWHRSIAQRLENAKSNIGYIVQLAERVRGALDAMEARASEAAQAQAGRS